MSEPLPSSKGRAWIAPALAFTAGAVDAIGFLGLGQVFLAHVTGNLVLLGATAVGIDTHSGHESWALQTAVLPLFCAGVAVGWLLLRRTGARAPIAIAVISAALLTIAATVALASPQLGPPVSVWLLASCGVLAMSLNAVLTRALALPMTNVMTGNVLQMCFDVLDASAGTPIPPGRIRNGVTLIVAFAAGAGAAAVCLRLLGVSAFALPACVLWAVAVQVSRMTHVAESVPSQPVNR
ncbi:MAG: DUF1275 domain-containing protein [Phycisphaerales bacterium]|nr:DUF1275 domain-containing protein [Phycisphaerales bacterium]